MKAIDLTVLYNRLHEAESEAGSRLGGQMPCLMKSEMLTLNSEGL
jgi:hypothetical protein